MVRRNEDYSALIRIMTAELMRKDKQTLAFSLAVNLVTSLMEQEFKEEFDPAIDAVRSEIEKHRALLEKMAFKFCDKVIAQIPDVTHGQKFKGGSPGDWARWRS